MRDFLEIYHDFYALDFVHHWTFALLVFIVIVDIVLGLLKGWATNTFKSSIARKGIVSHGTLIFIVVAVYPWISELGFSLLADAVMLFFIVSYIASVIGNLETLGVPIPTYIKNKLAEEIKSKDDTITEIFEQKKRRKKMIFSSNKVYNIIKWAVLVALPGISTFIGVIGKAYGWSGTELAIVSLNAFTVLLGTLAGVSAVKFSNQPNDTEEKK